MPPERVQGLVVLLGAAVFYALLSTDGADLGFHWTPLVIGGVFLVAATIGGPQGSYWSTALVLVVFGLAPVAIYEYDVDASAASLYVVALGAAVLLGALLEERGFAVGPTAIGATILALGLVYTQQGKVDLVTEVWPYAAYLAAVGAFRLAVAPRRSARGGSRR